MGVVGLAGSILYTQLSDGIVKQNLETSLAEARSSFFNAQYQFLFVEGKNSSTITKVVEDVVSSATTVGIFQGRKDIVLNRLEGQQFPTVRDYYLNFNRITGGVILDSIPKSLRTAIIKNDTIQYDYAYLNYDDGRRVYSLVTGRKLEIPSAGLYEIYLIYSLDNQNATLSLIKNSLLLTGLGLLLLIALITWLVARQVVSPVRDAAKIAAQFTKGDFKQRMKIESDDEIATLGTAFNEMAISLESQISRLENLSRVQQRFVSDVSHELRTPLTTLRMAAEVIHSNRSTFDLTIARSAELLIAQLDRFEQLLEELLEVSRFDAEVAVLDAVDFDVLPLLQKCIQMVGGENHITIDIDPEVEHIVINADMRRVDRIMRNLLSNALDHSEGKTIKIRVVETESEIAIGVRDFGEGLDAASLHRVFDRFWRADPSRARTRGGTGLGLSIALEDARLHNGELEAWARPGKGAHFVLTLPRRAGTAINSRPLRLEPVDLVEN